MFVHRTSGFRAARVGRLSHDEPMNKRTQTEKWDDIAADPHLHVSFRVVRAAYLYLSVPSPRRNWKSTSAQRRRHPWRWRHFRPRQLTDYFRADDLPPPLKFSSCPSRAARWIERSVRERV